MAQDCNPVHEAIRPCDHRLSPVSEFTRSCLPTLDTTSCIAKVPPFAGNAQSIEQSCATLRVPLPCHLLPDYTAGCLSAKSASSRTRMRDSRNNEHWRVHGAVPKKQSPALRLSRWQAPQLPCLLFGPTPRFEIHSSNLLPVRAGNANSAPTLVNSSQNGNINGHNCQGHGRPLSDIPQRH